MLKDWCIFRRLFCQRWQFGTNTVRWTGWNPQMCQQWNNAFLKHEDKPSSFHFRFCGHILNFFSPSRPVLWRINHSCCKQETSCFKSMNCRGLNSSSVSAENFMFQWWCQPKASFNCCSMSNTVQPFPQHLAAITPQTLICWHGCRWSVKSVKSSLWTFKCEEQCFGKSVSAIILAPSY